MDFPGGTLDKNLPANAGDRNSAPGLGEFHMPQSNWACDLEQTSRNYWACVPKASALQQEPDAWQRRVGPVGHS